MSTTSTVAVIGAVATPAVAVAGYVFNAWLHGQDREAAREARNQERRLAWASRAYDDRKSAYLTALRYALTTVQRAALTEPMITFEGQPQPPEPVGAEVWNAMHVEVGAFGSQDVSDALTALVDASTSFGYAVGRYRRVVGDPRAGGLAEAAQEMTDARAAVVTAYDALKLAINRDLAAA